MPYVISCVAPVAAPFLCRGDCPSAYPSLPPGAPDTYPCHARRRDTKPNMSCTPYTDVLCQLIPMSVKTLSPEKNTDGNRSFDNTESGP